MAETIDTAAQLIGLIERAMQSPLLPTPMLICIRTEDGDMLRIVDVEVVPDEIDAHIEILVVEDGDDNRD